jgi:glycerol kinase
MQQSKSEELILSIDAGTQSIRAALVDAGGNIIHIVKTPIQPYFSDHPGWAEQHPDYSGTCSAKQPESCFSKRKVSPKMWQPLPSRLNGPL